MRAPEHYASLERRRVPDNTDLYDAVAIPLEIPASPGGYGVSICIRIDTVPEETLVRTPDEAAAISAAILELSRNGTHGYLGFRVEYSV